MDVTGTDVLARCIVPINSNYAASIMSQESANGIHESGDNYWVGNTSRDEYMGVFFGLSVAYDLLGAGTQPAIQSLATRLLNFLTANAWSVVMPDGTVSTTFVIRPDEQLGLLQIGRQVNSAQFASAYQSFAANSAALASIPVLVDAADVRDSYFKFNLDAINLFSLIRLETDSKLLRELSIHLPDLPQRHRESHERTLQYDRPCAQRRKLHARSRDCVLSHSMASSGPAAISTWICAANFLPASTPTSPAIPCRSSCASTRISYGSGVRSSWTAAAPD